MVLAVGSALNRLGAFRGPFEIADPHANTCFEGAPAT